MAEEAHKQAADRGNRLEAAIGREVQLLRNRLNMTVVELAKIAGMSAGMLSKIENGLTSPSLTSLQRLSESLHVPVTAFFRRFEEKHGVYFVKSGEGIKVERRGTRAGYQFQLLGHSIGMNFGFEPYIVSITEKLDAAPLFQHPGVEFIFMMEGKADYRHGDQIFSMTPGDSLFFDSDTPHGIETVREFPIRLLLMSAYPPVGEK